MSEDLEIIGLSKNMLRGMVEANTLWKKDLAPMPKSKASWLISNERILEDDYCGVIAYENKQMIAFIYMLPDLINTKDGKGSKAYWMIDWWVTDKYKDSILGTYIYNHAIKLANKQVLIKGYTENVEEFYQKQPFTVITSRLRHTLFFSLDSSMLIGKFNFLKPVKFIIDGIDAIISKTIRFINKYKLNKKTSEIKYDFINHLDNETWNFIEPLCKNDLIYKTKEYVNWQINNSQYLQIPLANKKAYSNLQTGSSDNIKIHNVKILLDDKIIGFLSYVINYNEFNVKYFLVKDDNHYDLCIDALIENLIKSKRNFIFTDDTRLSDTINKRYFTIFTHKVLKKGLAHNDTKLDNNNVTMLNRDGHFY
ncbi:hypothetical protein A8C32_03555 [Flavivirga aquatica]|uniref:N-acetyltransferase domain-containing protein n=1 Tax=Flavivirga aquatica TaxID=1849968 RepID=A0A1E5TAY6_9FLAO|nr:hypothetical protein [Flavivirga aquatica]OEK08542.1 hypothetical protein A8C32_03555 [Flavivirga aquatica]